MRVTPLELGKLNGRYVVVWYEVDEKGAKKKRRRFRLKAKNRTEAWAEAQLRYDTELSLMGSKLTLADLWKAYSDYMGKRPAANDLAYVWKSMGPELGEFHPNQINDEVVARYLEKRKENFVKRNGRLPAKATIRKDVNVLQSVLNYAVKKRIIRETIKLDMPPRGRPRERWLDVDEVDRLVNAAKRLPHLYVAVALMLSTGGRVGAVLELTWDRVDFKARTIDLRVGDDEHKKQRAIIPMNDGLFEVLSEWRSQCDTEYVVEYQGDTIESITKGFKNTAKSVGLGDIYPHVLRRTAAVHMVASGCEMARVSQYLGHVSVETTERIYGRFAPKHLKDEARAVDFFKKPDKS